MSWYRTYRQTTLAGLHLEDVRAHLLRLLETNQFPHALLFAGPKGTGKTSAARIMSAILNDPQNADRVDELFFAKPGHHKSKNVLKEPDLTSEIVQRIQKGNSFAVQEMDAASNRGIDDIRQLKERVYLQPQEGKVSVYILDEVHMLTTEAFNALLKLLEEPPAHVVFILATTELHKLPETVVSRTTVIRFHTASEIELGASLTHILDAEKIKYDPAAVKQIAKLADGSFRDAVKMLEQVAAGKSELTVKDVDTVFQVSTTKELLLLVEAISQKNAQAVVEFFAHLRKQQVNEQYFYHSWLQFLHEQLLQAVTEVQEPPLLVPMKISHYLLSQFHHLALDTTASIPFLSLELKSLEIVFKALEKAPTGGAGAVSKGANTGVTAAVMKSAPVKAMASNVISSTISDTFLSEDLVEEIANVVPIAVVDFPFAKPLPAVDQVITAIESRPAIELINQWTQFLTELKKNNLTLEALLRSATPRVSSEGTAQIEVYYQFHREQLQQPKFLRIIQDCVAKVLGGYVQFEFVLAKKSQFGASASTVSGRVNEEDQLLQLAKDILV